MIQLLIDRDFKKIPDNIDRLLVSGASLSDLGGFPDADMPSFNAKSVYKGDETILCSSAESEPPPVNFCFESIVLRFLALALILENFLL